MDDIDALSNADLPQDAHDVHKSHKRVLTGKGQQGQMVDLHSIGDIANAQSLFTVGIRHDHYLMTEFHQALAQLEHVHLDTSKVWEEVIAH